MGLERSALSSGRTGRSMELDLRSLLFGEKSTEIFKQLEGFRTERRKKLEDLQALIDLRQYENVQQTTLADDDPLRTTLRHQIKSGEDLPIVVDVVFSAAGWETVIFVNGRKPGTSTDLKNLLCRENIRCIEGYTEGHPCFVDPIHFKSDEAPERVAKRLQSIVRRIARNKPRGTGTKSVHR